MLGEQRRVLMITSDEALTRANIRVHGADRSPGIERVRELRVALDEAVAEAYGWGDLALEHGCHGTTQGVRFAVGEGVQVQVEVLDRLLELSHERYGVAVEAGLHGKGKGKVGRRVVEVGQGALGVVWGGE